MNFYNPYYIMPARSGGLLSFLGRNSINLSTILSGTQKTLNIINQAIPIVKQAAPMFQNAKTMFKVMNEFKKVDTPSKETKQNIKKEVKENNISGPTFFI